VVLQRRHDAPRSWLNKQRQMVNGTQHPPLNPFLPLHYPPPRLRPPILLPAPVPFYGLGE
jgi:hypothetical protein